MSFLHSAILFALVALAIPVIVHLLNRRRVVVVDWAAMQFLKVSRRARRTVMLEHMLLLAVRILLIACLVLAVALPVLRISCLSRLPAGGTLASLAGHTQRDLVIIIDGSDSMLAVHEGKTAHDEARSWVRELVNALPPGDRVAIIQAKERPITVLNRLSADRQELYDRLEQMPPPRGSVDWPRSLEEAQRAFEGTPDGGREIIILSDGQRQGWADGTTLGQWQSLGRQPLPRIWVVNVAGQRPATLPNWSVSPITANRTLATVGREVIFRFNLQTRQPNAVPPKKFDVLVDGKRVGEQSVPRSTEPSIALTVKHSFTTVGSHVVSIRIPDDAMPGDNRRDFAIDVLPAIPVLLVDGNAFDTGPARGSDFIRYAIAPPNHPQPSFAVKAIGINAFASQVLNEPITADPSSTPRVLVLQNIARLNSTQHQAIEQFIANGHGVLVLPGPRTEAAGFNRLGHRAGDGWLPASLGGIVDNATSMLLPDGLEQTFLEPLAKGDADSVLKSNFTGWWKLDPAADGASVIARLQTGDPFLVEKRTGAGRVLQSAVPFDDSWKNDLLRSHDFVRLCHECLFHLAGARAREVNLSPSQPLLHQPAAGEPPGRVTVFWPDGRQRRFEVPAWPLTVNDTREPGVYRVADDGGRSRYYVVQADGNESNLQPCGESDRQSIADMFPPGRLRYENERPAIFNGLRDGARDPEFGWLLLLAVLGLLLTELAITRAHIRDNPPVND